MIIAIESDDALILKGILGDLLWWAEKAYLFRRD